MLSYRHAFHAGNFADVVKHTTLALTLAALQKKAKGLFYLDTHAAAGRYDLDSEQAQKNREHDGGIVRLWDHPTPPASLSSYLDAVRALNPNEQLRYYPGSPRIARHLLRPQDRMALCELHNHEIELLALEFAQDKQVTLLHDDGYKALSVLLPPPERRGLVMIDPSFERKDEHEHLTKALLAALRRWETGVYLVWFPLHREGFAQRLYQPLIASGIRKVLSFELHIDRPSSQPHMFGTGMLVINPPWQLAEQLQSLAPWLWQQLSPAGKGHHLVQWVVPE